MYMQCNATNKNVLLFNNGAEKLQTTSDGVLVSDNISANSITLDNNFSIYKVTGTTDVYFVNSGQDPMVLHTKSNMGFQIDGTLYMQCNATDKNVLLFQNGSLKFRTISTGVSVNGSVSYASDDRIKSNETPITNATETLLKLSPVTYDQYNDVDKTGDSYPNTGLIAQHIYYNAPELRPMVTLNTDASGNTIVPLETANPTNEIAEDDYETKLNWGSDVVGVNYNYVIPYLIKSIQELQERISVLENNN